MKTETEIVTAGVPSAELTLLEALIVLAKAKMRIAFFTVGVSLLAAIVSLVLPKWYTATAKIMPPQESGSAAALLAGQLGGLAGLVGNNLGLANPSQIYVTMLQSRTVADAMVRRFDLMKVYREKRLSDARRDLEKATTIVADKEAVISISVEDKDPNRAAMMANAYVDELRNLAQTVAVSEASQRRLFFQKQLESEKNSLADAEVALKETEERTGMIQPEAQTRASLESVVRLRAAITAKEVQLTGLRSFGTEQNPQVRAAESELGTLRSQLAGMERRRGNQNLEVPTRQMPQAALEYARRLRDVKYHEYLFELLARQYEAAKVDEAKTATVIQVIDSATLPDKKSWPPRALVVIVSATAAFLLACLWVLFKDYLARAREVPESRVRLEMLRNYLLSK